MCFFFNDTSTTETYTYLHTLSLHDALPIFGIDEVEGLVRRHLVAHVVEHEELGFRSPERDVADAAGLQVLAGKHGGRARVAIVERSEEHTSELQSLMRISYAVFCLKKQTNTTTALWTPH